MNVCSLIMATWIYWSASIVVVFGIIITLCDGQAQQIQPNLRQTMSEYVRRTVGLDPEIHRAYVNAYEGDGVQSTTATSNRWASFAPRLPSANETDCFVEVFTISRRGGRCTRLGGFRSQPFICQSGTHFEFNPMCENIMANRYQVRAAVQEAAHP